MRYRVVERRFYNYPFNEELSSRVLPSARKSVTFLIEVPDTVRVCGNVAGRNSSPIRPINLQMLWGRYPDGWVVERLCAMGWPVVSDEGWSSQEFDHTAADMPEWILVLLRESWPVDEEVVTGWADMRVTP